MLRKIIDGLKSAYNYGFDVNDTNIEQLRLARDRFFARSKTLSDFVQIVISLAGSIYVAGEISTLKASADGIFELIILNFAKVASLVFIVYLTFYSSTTVYFYILAELIVIKNKFIRFIWICIGILAHLGIVYALIRIIGTLAKTFAQ